MRIILTIAFIGLFNSYSQNIKVYFNQSVDNTVSTITDAHQSSNLDDTICTIINASNVTLDIAVWDNGSTKIVTALNNAYTRGVQVRYISATNSLNTALTGLNSNIPLLKRTANLTVDVMHNKFVIADNFTLLTGSMNFGSGSMFNDYNNIVITKDANLAQAYTTEFNEMWGSTGAQPNTSNSKFGPDKTDNTTHSFTIGTSTIQLYFSPTDNTTAQIVNAINSADHTLDIAMFTFINNDLGDAVIAAKNRGVTVRCIIENINYFGSEYSALVSAGINVLSHDAVTNDFHHKYCIVDAMFPSSDPLVVTGSHNWTNSAETDNDENTLIIHDETIANQYTEEFSKRFGELGGVGITEQYASSTTLLFPNPNNGTFQLKTVETIKEIEIVNVLGETIYSLSNIIASEVIHLNLSTGIYFVRIRNALSSYTEKLIVE